MPIRIVYNFDIIDFAARHPLYGVTILFLFATVSITPPVEQGGGIAPFSHRYTASISIYRIERSLHLDENIASSPKRPWQNPI